MRTEIRVIQAIVGPILDKPFLSLCLQGGRAWLSLQQAFGLGKRCSGFFYLLQGGDNSWQQKQRCSTGNLLVLLCVLSGESASSACSTWFPWPDFEEKAFYICWFSPCLSFRTLIPSHTLNTQHLGARLTHLKHQVQTSWVQFLSTHQVVLLWRSIILCLRVKANIYMNVYSWV